MLEKNVLVTGANGMIGRQLVKLLKEKGANVTGTDLPTDLRYRDECKEVLKEWYRVLKPGGCLRMAVPDFENCSKMVKN